MHERTDWTSAVWRKYTCTLTFHAVNQILKSNRSLMRIVTECISRNYRCLVLIFSLLSNTYIGWNKCWLHKKCVILYANISSVILNLLCFEQRSSQMINFCAIPVLNKKFMAIFLWKDLKHWHLKLYVVLVQITAPEELCTILEIKNEP